MSGTQIGILHRVRAHGFKQILSGLSITGNRMLVYTTKGLIERDQLEIKDVVSEEDNARVMATEWYLNGELVRRDVNVNILRGQSVLGEQGEI